MPHFRSKKKINNFFLLTYVMGYCLYIFLPCNQWFNSTDVNNLHWIRNWAWAYWVWSIILLSGNHFLFRQGTSCDGKCKHFDFIFLFIANLLYYFDFFDSVLPDSLLIRSHVNDWTEIHHAIFYQTKELQGKLVLWIGELCFIWYVPLCRLGI